MARTKGRRSCWTAADVRGPLLTSEEAAVTAAADSRRASAPTARGALPPVHAGPGPTPCRRLYRLPRYAGRPSRRHFIRQGRNRDIRRRLTRPPLGSLLTAARRSPARPVRRLQRRRYTRDDHQKTPWGSRRDGRTRPSRRVGGPQLLLSSALTRMASHVTSND